MIQMSLKVVPPPNKTPEVVHALRLQIGPTQVLPGCILCRVSQDSRDQNIILFQEEWTSWGELEKYLRSDRFSDILELMEISSTRPDLTFSDVQETRGIDYVRKVRKTNGEF